MFTSSPEDNVFDSKLNNYPALKSTTQWPEFTKEVCRQTEIYVRHMTRFDAFFYKPGL